MDNMLSAFFREAQDVTVSQSEKSQVLDALRTLIGSNTPAFAAVTVSSSR